MFGALVGFAIAAAIALTGVGAGVLTAPVLMLAFGLEPAVAVGTALTFGSVVKLPALLAYAWRGQVDLRTTGRMIAGGLPGVVLGGLLLQRLSLGGARGVVLLAVGAVVLTSAGLGLRRAFGRGTGATQAAHGSVSAVTAVGRETATRERPIAWLSALIGVEVGFTSAGAGALGTLLLLHRTRLAPATVVGTDLAFGLALSLVGGGLHLAHGSWDGGLFASLVAGGLIGALAGVQLASWVPAKTLRVGLLVWLVAIGGHMTAKGIDATFAGDSAASHG
jgi:uncharacterized membrane protein YfcA